MGINELSGFWRDLLVMSSLMNVVLGALVFYFRAAFAKDIHELKNRMATAETQRAEKVELNRLGNRVAEISRDYASRNDIEKISAKIDTVYLLLLKSLNAKADDR